MNDRVSEELLAAAAKQCVDEVIHEIKVQPLNFLDFISAVDGRLVTDSLKVAAVHGKRHDDVLRLIRKRAKDAGGWGLRNFAEGVYFDPRNQQNHPMYTMTKDGYQFLVAKLSGAKAVEHQIAYIEAFNAMAEYVKNQRDGLRFRCMELELEDADSKRRGSHHAKGLNLRKREKRVIDPELAELKEKVQPKLV
jgi:Rha family phage regulatory protein